MAPSFKSLCEINPVPVMAANSTRNLMSVGVLVFYLLSVAAYGLTAKIQY